MAIAVQPHDALQDVCRVAPDADLPAYAVDGVAPQAVAFPTTADQIAAIVKLAAEHGWALIPRGGGTQMGLGNIPRAADVVVCTGELNQVLEYEPADLVVTVQAGMRLAELQRILGERGQFLALDPPLPAQATIGGIIAANASGPLRLRHGTVRDMLIGISVVSPDGSIAKGGGKVVKNVTGYDMGKLYTGSLGTLGIILEASFKLAPLPALEATVLASFGELGPAYEAARTIYKSGLPVRACELLSPAAAKASEYVLATWIGGGTAAVERQKRDVTGLCGAAAGVRSLAGDDARQLWRNVEDFGRDATALAKVSVLPSRTGELLARLPEGSVFVSHVVSGVTFIVGADPAVLGGIVRELGGYLLLEACPLEVKRRLDVWGPAGADFRLMERIKREFDPRGILNPGRYVGRL